jgi:hypothetical protein
LWNTLGVTAARHCDIVSYDIDRYPEDTRHFRFPGEVDVTLIIGEWRFGRLDHGMFDCGVKPARNEVERAANYQAYMKAALGHPQFIGAHWFRYNNHPTAAEPATATADSRLRFPFARCSLETVPNQIHTALQSRFYPLSTYHLASSRLA